VDEVLAASPAVVADYRRGKTAAKQALVGLVMKRTRGTANPALVQRLLEEKLSRG
jgi:aspartyl-tRNA(Asn)/glutamyl-tRNA(Gln) amidotransferase subunit B